MATHSSILAWRIPFWPGESSGQRILEDYNPWDHKELDMTECSRARTHTRTHTHTQLFVNNFMVTLHRKTSFLGHYDINADSWHKVKKKESW